MTQQGTISRTRIYRIGPELEDEHFALIHNGVAQRYENGDLTVALFPEAARAYFALTGLPVETPVHVEGRAFGLREAELQERVHLLHELVVPQLLAGAIQQKAGTAITLFADGGWRFGPLEEGVETPPVLWQTTVNPLWVKTVKDAFLLQIQQELQQRIDRLRNGAQEYR